MGESKDITGYTFTRNNIIILIYARRYFLIMQKSEYFLKTVFELLY